jgi:hypothetical protein
MDDKIDDQRGIIGVIVAIIFILLIGIVGVFAMNIYLSNNPEIKKMEGIEKVTQREMVASLKGSIYSNGEAISVFGTCVDTYDIPVTNATAWFSAWYPNGTQFVSSVNMTQLSPGYFLYSSIMSAVQGTYLTEVVCNATIGGINQFAKAWGEWQNPYWTNAIINLSNMTFNVNLTNVTNQLNAISSNITYLNYTIINNFNTTNQLILDTQMIANASVDRNSSLLAQLLYLLVNYSTYGGPCSDLNVSQYSVDTVRYWTDWTVKVKVNQGTTLKSDPDVYCLINTTQTATTYMDVEGDHFTFTELITTPPHGDYNWSIGCACS